MIKETTKTKKVATKTATVALPELNIGILGHVDHGKTTLTQMLTGKFTDEHSEELKRGISIRLGYADMTINKCPKCSGAAAYSTFSKCFICGSDTKHLRTLSVVDVPGHETLMATVLTGASLLDGAILVIAANEKCPQPQTKEHLAVLNISGIKNIIIVQNKIDLVDAKGAKENYDSIKTFLKGSVAENAPIIPISAQHKANIEVLLNAIQDILITPKHDSKKNPKMIVARSFDINKPGKKIKDLIGGVVGGSIVDGAFKPGDEIELRPGIKQNNDWAAIKTKILSINKGKTSVMQGTSGGLVALSTTLDPYVAKSDSLVGTVIGLPGKMPPVWKTLKLEINIIDGLHDTKENILKNDPILMSVGTARTIGVCTQPGKTSDFILKLPVCADISDKVALSKQIAGRFRLIGYGIVKK
ncbi:translation initiation factor IF-2 subunit gamma [archaeon]|nr:translation initiation factor IF-2 subunit gamma [archaeon]